LNEPVLFRTYTTAKAVDTLGISNCTIWQAGRATSAAPTFFDPIEIGNQLFVDGATGRNNPVEEVLAQAKLIWSDVEHRIQCIISIGTGVPDLEDFGDNLKKVIDTIKAIAVETETTERRFSQNHERLGVGGRYFRYNVQQGLGNVGLDEHKEVPRIQVATKHYLELPQMEVVINAFVNARVPDICL
jgi:predicted acylesterase/phospholipase RssA